MAQINRSPSKSQVKDAYDILYRQMLRQERMGNGDAVRIIGSAIRGLDKQMPGHDGRCIAATEVGMDGSLKHRWLKIDNIKIVRKTPNGTEIYFYDGGAMVVRESVQDIIVRTNERNGQK